MDRRKGLLNDRRGAAIAEYGLIAAIVGATIAVASLARGAGGTNAITAPENCPAGQTSC